MDLCLLFNMLSTLVITLLLNKQFRYDLNQIPHDYTVEVTNRFKGLDLIDSLCVYLWPVSGLSQQLELNFKLTALRAQSRTRIKYNLGVTEGQDPGCDQDQSSLCY